ncbi:MAG TPA: hypothetical protein VH760_04095 [Gaiellaceae bacterium]|jgi:hypothetical protein
MSARSRTTQRRAPFPDPQVVEWRHDQLRRAGFPPSLADRAATDERLDLHAVIELVERGCPPELALRILAPIDDDEER